MRTAAGGRARRCATSPSLGHTDAGVPRRAEGRRGRPASAATPCAGPAEATGLTVHEVAVGHADLRGRRPTPSTPSWRRRRDRRASPSTARWRSASSPGWPTGASTVPDEVSVVGGDDVPMAAMTAPPLTAISLPDRGGRRRRPSSACRRTAATACELDSDLRRPGLDGAGQTLRSSRQRRRRWWAAAFGRRSRVNTPFLLPSTRMNDVPGGEVGEVPHVLARPPRRCGRRPGGTCRAGRPGTPRSRAPGAPSGSPDIVSAPYSVTRIGLSCLSAHARSSASRSCSAASRSPASRYQP